MAITHRTMDLEGGKYRIILTEGRGVFRFECFRNGEPWQNLEGNKLMYALFTRAKELEAGMALANMQLEAADNEDN